MAKRKSSRPAHDTRYYELGRAVWQHYRMRCYTHLTQALRNKHLKALPDGVTDCAYCGTTKAVLWEHRDYTDPLNVVPACAKCNNSLPPAELDPAIVILHLNGFSECPWSPHSDLRPEWKWIKRPTQPWPEWVFDFFQGPR